MMLDTAYLDKRRWLNLILQILAGAAIMLVYMAHVWMLPLHETYNWDMKIISLQFTLVAASGVVASILGGKLREMWGDRKLLMISGIGFGVSIMICSISLSVWFFVIGAGVLASFFMFFISISQVENISELFPDKNGLALGLYFFGYESLCAFLSPVAVWLMDTFGLPMSFIIQGIGYGCVLVIISRLIVVAPESYRPQGWEPSVIEAVDEEDGGKTIDEIDRTANWKGVLLAPGFWVFAITLFFAVCIPIGISANYTYLSVEAMGIDTSEAAWNYVIYGIAMSLGSVVIGFLSDIFGIMHSFAAITFLLAIGFFATIFIAPESSTLFFIVMSLAGFTVGAYSTVLAITLVTGWGEENYGLLMGIFGICASVINYVGPQMSLRLDVDTFFTIGGVFCLIATVMSFLVIKSINKQVGYKVLK